MNELSMKLKGRVFPLTSSMQKVSEPEKLSQKSQQKESVICFPPLSGFLTLFGSQHPPTSVVRTEPDASLSTPYRAKTIQWRDFEFPSEKRKKNLSDRSRGIVDPLPRFTFSNTAIGNLSSFGGF